MADQEFDPDLNHFGRELRGLNPRSCPLNRDAVMFRAGQASVPRNWLWPVATALFAGLSVTFGAALLVQPGPVVQVNHSYSPPPTISRDWDQPPDVSPPTITGTETTNATEDEPWAVPDASYFHTQNNVLRWGLDGVPLPPTTTAPPRTEKWDMLFRSF